MTEINGDTTTSAIAAVTKTNGNNNDDDTKTHLNVQEYYGKNLQNTNDLLTNACCTGSKPPQYIINCINNIHTNVTDKYYGCGLCIPNYNLNSLHILDLGCGSGRDVYIASQLVGTNGKVYGIDMTIEQLNIAKEYQDYHSQKFGYNNTQFIHGYLEELDTIPELQDKFNTLDVIISNCVLNLCTNKLKVLQSCYKLLKPGGEMYFSDVYASRRVPDILKNDTILYGECLSGALYWNDFKHMAIQAGFLDPRLVSDSPITIANDKVRQKMIDTGYGNIEFFSATYRLYKLPNVLEPACEDYGQAIVYKGTIPLSPSEFILDKKHIFETGKIYTVCGNTYHMLQTKPLIDHFIFYGNFDTHYGIYDGCGTTMPFDSSDGTKGSSCC